MTKPCTPTQQGHLLQRIRTTIANGVASSTLLSKVGYPDLIKNLQRPGFTMRLSTHDRIVKAMDRYFPTPGQQKAGATVTAVAPKPTPAPAPVLNGTGRIHTTINMIEEVLRDARSLGGDDFRNIVVDRLTAAMLP